VQKKKKRVFKQSQSFLDLLAEEAKSD